MLKRNKRLNPGDKPLKRTELRSGDKPIRPVGKRGKRLRKGDDAFHDEVFALWGDRCLLRLAGCQRAATDCAHGYSKGAHPEWRYDPLNAFPLCRICHGEAHSEAQVAAQLRQWVDERRNRP